METTQEALYSRHDRFAELIRKKVRQEFHRLLLSGWDELNVTRAAEVTRTIYERVDRMNRRHYAEICEWVYEWVYVQYGREVPYRDWTKVVDDWLKGYDPTTKYVYENELERKRLRLYEGILACRETLDRPGLEKLLKQAADLLVTQSIQYGLDLVGEMQEEAYGDAADEDELLLYHACDDSRVCSECWDCNGKVYPVNGAPRLPQHYRCRCWYTRFIQS